jgi:cytoskeletal protein CcmA (bactofilin family)
MALFTQKDDTQTTPVMQTTATRPQTNGGMSASGGQTIFGATLIVEGTIKSSEHITVNGELKGTVETTESIMIGKEAKIDAALTGKTISIAGTVTGNITATDALVLESSAVIRGDIKAGSIQIQTGALIDGNMHIGKTSKPATSSAAPQTEKPTA